MKSGDNRLAVLVNRSLDIFRQEGVKAFAGRAADYFATYIFKYEKYFVLEHILEARDKRAYLPLTDNYELVIVPAHSDADRLALRINYDFREHLLKAKERLNAGAVAFCIIVDGKFASIGWVAGSEPAKNLVDPTPYKVDFSRGEGNSGGVFTFPEFRNLKLMQYCQWARYEYLRERGVKNIVTCVNVKNVASQFVNTKFAATVRGKGILLTICGLRFWREVPVKDSEVPAGMKRSRV